MNKYRYHKQLLYFLHEKEFNYPEYGLQNDYPKDDYKISRDELIKNGLIEKTLDGKGHPCLVITGLGKQVVKEGNLELFFESKITDQNNEARRKHLELRKLENEVSLMPWQFWLFVIGSAVGILSFVLTVYQLITSSK